MSIRDSIHKLTTYSGARNVLDSAAAAFEETRQDRLRRYQLNWSYYLNQMYDPGLITTLSGKAARRSAENLYFKIKSLFNVCTQACDIDAAAILAPPVVVTANGNLESNIVEVWKRSELQSRLSRLILYGAVYGDAYLRLADETTAPRIVIHPPTEFDITVNPFDPSEITQAELSYNFFTGSGLRTLRTYTLKITPDQYSTYLDDKPHDYDGRGAAWDNTLGWIPVVPLRLIDDGDVYGVCTFQPVLAPLDAVNEIASQMADVVRMNADPQLVAYNIKAGALIKGEDTKGQTTVWYANGQSASDLQPKLELLEWSGSIQGLTEFLDWCKGNIEETIPEWHLKRVREQASPSGYSVSLQLTELQLKIAGMRRNAIEALRRINAMAMVASGKASDLADVSHDIEVGTILPRDQEMTQKLAAADLAVGAIDRIEYLQQRGHDRKEAERLIAAADVEREAMMMAGAAWPSDDDKANDGAPFNG